MSPFDFVNSINSTKQDMMTGTENDALAESSYVPFVVNRALSYFADTLLYANEMNKLQPDNKLQYHYLLNSIRPAKRFAKWAKRTDVDDLENVKQYYGYSTDKALTALSILTRDQLRLIEQKVQRGGENDNSGVFYRGKARAG